MKKILQITIGIIALGFIVVIAKNTLFTSADEKWYNEGWNAHEKGDYNTAIFYFNRLDKTKYPDVYVGLGSSYLNTGDFKNAIQNFLEAYKKNIGKGTQDYNKIRNSLGYCYLQIRDYRNARVYFNEAKQLGNENSNINLQILDSLEQKKEIN